MSLWGMTLWDVVLRLFVSLVLASLIGLERETHGRPAGLRTHVLVCMGSTLFTICSYIIAGPHNDPGRISAQIVTGVGFLGAGTIIHQGSVVRGLTTAASIWAVAAIGLAVGIGGDMMWVAAIASVMVFATLNIMGRVDKYLVAAHDERRISITTSRDPEHVCDMLRIMANHDAKLRSVDTREGDDGETQVLRLRIIVGRDFDETALASDLASSRYVLSYSWE